MDYYKEIKQELINNEIKRRVKLYVINKNDLTTYYNVGKMLSEAGKHYGEGIIKEYSKKLTSELGKGYTITRLKYYRQFYLLNTKSPTASDQLTFSHFCELFPLNDINKIKYYINVCEKQNLSVRELRARIKSKEYERIPKNAKENLISNIKLDIKDLIPEPVIIKNDNQKTDITEYALKELILNNLDDFLKELGSGFSYIGNEFKIKMGSSYNYIDLLLFNIDYNCYVVVELKATKLQKEHIGQIEIYMNYIDNNLKKINQDKTIGIIICKKNNKYIIEYCSDKRIISRVYEIL